MPTNSKVHRCADKLEAEGKEKGSAIAICTASTGQNYHTGKPLKKYLVKKSPFAIRRKSLGKS